MNLCTMHFVPVAVDPGLLVHLFVDKKIIFEMEKWQSALSPVFFVVVSSGSYTEIQVGSIYLPQKIGCSSQDDIKTLRP